MSYQDPYYAGHHATGTSTQYLDNQPQTIGASVDYYNPYHSTGQQYTDEGQPEQEDQDHVMVYNNYPPPQREPTLPSRRTKPLVSVAPVRRESSGFDQGEFTPGGVVVRGPKSAQALREYRYGHQGNLCTKGGRVRCFARICCCSLMTTVFLIVSIVLALALWVRPPSITIGSVQTMTGTTGSVVQTTTDGLTVNLGVNISVINPNYFSVDFKKINAEIFYPINNTPVGGGSTTDIVFHSRSQTSFIFPFSLSYNITEDPHGAVLADLISKCGAEKSNLNITYKIALGIRILIATISPVISNQFNFPCPISTSDLGSLGKLV